MTRFFAILLISHVSSATLLLAQAGSAGSPYDHDRDAPRAIASRITTTIHVDGVLDEAAWETAVPVTELTQYDPQEGQPASERSDIRIMYDDVALYIGARLYDRQSVRTRVGRRDMSMSASDWLTVIIDARHDHRTSFGFEVNPAGVRRDQTRAGGQEDDSWDPVWQAETAVTDSGWVAELRIPFSQVRFSGTKLQAWGLQIERQIARNQEFSVWAFTPRDEPGGAPRYGHLTGLAELVTGKRLEIMPYAVGRAEYIDRGPNPFRTGHELTLDAGADLKYRLTSSLTLDATANPDFGQVEVDPAVVNLTAFETFFPERRPFFIEGSELFGFGTDGSNSVFYSRRIGRRPSLAPQYAASDVPDATRILGAAKLTGRTTGGWSMGVLDAVTARETARFRTAEDVDGTALAEPRTNYFVGRVRREMREGQTAFGGLIGAVNRDLETPEIAAVLRSAAYSGGVDWFRQWSGRTVTLEGFLAGSHVRGEPGVIAATQRLPYHYFQRPDAEHLEYDPARTSLNGFAGSISIRKRSGRHWNFGGTVNTTSPGYEVSDLGFQRRADRLDAQAGVSYSDTRPRGVVRRHSLYAETIVEHNYGWENISNRIFAGGNAQFLNYWNTGLNLSISLPGTLDDRLTRGGPSARRPGSVSLSGFVGSDQRKPLVGVLESFVQRGGSGQEVGFFSSVEIRPAPHWEVTLGPSFSRSYDVAQYIQSVDDPTATHTYGARYVFAELHQKTLALQMRVNYTFTPGLSLQVFAQPFIAAGNFGAPKEFAAPGQYEFLVYGRDIGDVEDGRIYPSGRNAGLSFAEPDPDFNVRSLRGNAVLRWEWRPGSTLYLAWQQTRSGFQPMGEFNVGRDVKGVFASAPDDILLLKVSWWLNP